MLDLSPELDRRRAPLDMLPTSWPASLVVRPCNGAADAKGLWALFDQEGYRRFGTLLEQFESPDQVAEWLEAHRSGSFQIVGLVGGNVIAFAGLYPLAGRQGHVGWISIGVDERFQRRGFGRSLLRLVIATADLWVGLERLQLHVFTDNIPAIALYQAFGFEIEGRHDRFARRGDAYVDAFTMARLTHDA
jgi:putative acetyltransferase